MPRLVFIRNSQKETRKFSFPLGAQNKKIYLVARD
jgi:hypothetical protein